MRITHPSLVPHVRSTPVILQEGGPAGSPAKETDERKETDRATDQVLLQCRCENVQPVENFYQSSSETKISGRARTQNLNGLRRCSRGRQFGGSFYTFRIKGENVRKMPEIHWR